MMLTAGILFLAVLLLILLRNRNDILLRRDVACHGDLEDDIGYWTSQARKVRALAAALYRFRVGDPPRLADTLLHRSRALQVRRRHLYGNREGGNAGISRDSHQHSSTGDNDRPHVQPHVPPTTTNGGETSSITNTTHSPEQKTTDDGDIHRVEPNVSAKTLDLVKNSSTTNAQLSHQDKTTGDVQNVELHIPAGGTETSIIAKAVFSHEERTHGDCVMLHAESHVPAKMSAGVKNSSVTIAKHTHEGKATSDDHKHVEPYVSAKTPDGVDNSSITHIKCTQKRTTGHHDIPHRKRRLSVKVSVWRGNSGIANASNFHKESVTFYSGTPQDEFDVPSVTLGGDRVSSITNSPYHYDEEAPVYSERPHLYPSVPPKIPDRDEDSSNTNTLDSNMEAFNNIFKADFYVLSETSDWDETTNVSSSYSQEDIAITGRNRSQDDPDTDSKQNDWCETSLTEHAQFCHEQKAAGGDRPQIETHIPPKTPHWDDNSCISNAQNLDKEECEESSHMELHEQAETSDPVGDTTKSLILYHDSEEEFERLRMFQYDVLFEPDDLSMQMKRDLLKKHGHIFGAYLFYETGILCCRRLLANTSDKMALSSGEQNFRITIRMVGSVQFKKFYRTHLFNLAKKKGKTTCELQVVCRKTSTIDRKPCNVQRIWQQFAGHKRFPVNSPSNEIILKLRIGIPVLHIFRECVQNGQGFEQRFMRAVAQGIVYTNHNQKIYKIENVVFRANPDYPFTQRGGEKHTLKEYYLRKHNITITESNQPLLVSRHLKEADRRALRYLIPEMCTLICDPQNAHWDAGVRILSYEPDGSLQSPQVEQRTTVGEDGNEGPTRPTDPMNFQNYRAIEEAGERSSSEDESHVVQQLQHAPQMRYVQNWGVVCPRVFMGAAVNFELTFHHTAYWHGLILPDPLFFEIDDSCESTYTDAIEKSIHSQNPQLLLIIVPNFEDQRYNSILRKCCVERAVLCVVLGAVQVVQQAKIRLSRRIALQLQCALGLKPWARHLPSGFMAVGVAREGGTGHFVTAVFSLENTLARFYSVAVPREPSKRLSRELDAQVLEALDRHAHRHEGRLPIFVAIYASEALEEELGFIADALERAYTRARKRLSFIRVLVMSGISHPPTAQGSAAQAAGGNMQSPSDQYDFCVAPMTCREGATNPAFYRVTHNRGGCVLSGIQKITYVLTEGYANLDNKQRVPAPLYYAQKLAALAERLQCSPNSLLNDFLYYL